jgi:ribonucleoside-triphosphate reductase
MNIIGKIVVAGNVRRSAQIALGDCDDIEYLQAKRWDLGGIPNWRAMSNNSVVCSDISQLPEEFWEGYNGNGEPYGLINLEASRRMGRTFEVEYPDPRRTGIQSMR